MNTQNNNYNNQLEVVKKSNRLIQALGNPSLLAEKVLLLSLIKVEDRDDIPVTIVDKERYSRIQSVTGTDFSKGLVAEVSNAELRRLSNSRSGSYYDSIKTLLNPSKTDPRTLRNNLVFMAPDENGVLGYTELITSAAYHDGTMYVKFNPEESVKKEIVNLKNNYALLDVSLMMQWKSIYSYRVYELIQSKVGYDDAARKKQGKKPKDSYSYQYEFGELKFLLGILDATADKIVKNTIESGKRPDYNKIAEDMTERTGKGKSCAKYADLKRYALDKAEKEINSCENKDCEYTIKFEPVRNGRGGKVTHVILYVQRRRAKEDSDNIVDNVMSEDDKLDFIDSLRMTSLNNLPTKDLRNISECAGYDMEKINKAVEVMEASGTIDNVTGFILSAIKNEWSVTSVNNTKRANTTFHNFDMKHDYDFDEMEKVLLTR